MTGIIVAAGGENSTRFPVARIRVCDDAYTGANCTDCAPGHYSGVSSVCTACPAAYVQPAPNQTECTFCLSQHVGASSENATLCECLPAYTGETCAEMSGMPMLVVPNKMLLTVKTKTNEWKLGSFGESCDDVCGENSLCEPEALAQVDGSMANQLFDAAEANCQCIVKGVVSWVNEFAPYFGGTGGTNCGIPDHTKGCVYANFADATKPTCSGKHGDVRRLCFCTARDEIKTMTLG